MLGVAAAARRAPERGRAPGPWVLAALLLAGLWLAQPFRIPSASMRDTLLPGDYVLVQKLEYGLPVPWTGRRLPALRPPRRGDVVVFRNPRERGEDFIKRCIAVGGETVEIRDKRVIVNGDTLAEPYAIHTDRATRPGGYDYRDNFGPLTVAAGQVFMLGDNRDDSDDSRYWGPVPLGDVAGRPMVIYWSWDEASGGPRWNRILRRVR